MWYVSLGFGALELEPWPGRQKVTTRQREVMAGDSVMCRNIFEDEERGKVVVEGRVNYAGEAVGGFECER
jgi:hypothetical protein